MEALNSKTNARISITLNRTAQRLYFFFLENARKNKTRLLFI
jgi:hypothetical protein